ncbi:MAG: GNAT family N-acetyltransferase [Myxococcales bacterium]|nr:GNAT family N-acetyltransferase [Myxococcales bacterium]MCB9708013.1 GNAT family N-acetyltransferase [Myxococcales bacterium]
MTLHIREHRPGRDMQDFLRAGEVVFKDDPAWVQPLNMDLRERLTPEKNPFFAHAEATLFTAWRDDQLVGRCSAQIDREHLRIYQDKTGFFGFFDTLDDQEAGRALLRHAEDWLKKRQMTRIRGPLSLSMNEEVGLLVDGFEHPPAIMMAHSRPHQGDIVEASGFAKAKDLFAWHYNVMDIPDRAIRAWEQIRVMPEVRMRPVDPSRLAEELEVIIKIFNDAWSKNWGFVPVTQAELEKVAKDLRLIIDPNVAFIVEIHGEPAAMCIGLPNLNESIADLSGKLLPTGILKLLWRMKVKGPTSARLIMLGIRQDIRKLKRYGALSVAMYVELVKRAAPAGYRSGELSWTLEDNRLINVAIKAMGARHYKTYRIYEKALD